MISENNFIQISVGTVCSKEYMDEFIQKLEKRQGVDMKIIQNNKQFSIQCSDSKKNLCPFRYLFTKIIDVESKQMGLELKKRHNLHSVECNVYNEQICFQRNRLLIINSKTFITDILLSRYEIYGPQNPKKILEIVSQSMGFDEIFINKGIRSQELKRRIKKKFDNLVAQIRKQHNLTPTKIKKNKSLKKAKPKYSLFKQNFESYENFEQKMSNSFSSEEIDDQSEFKPTKKIKNMSSDKKSIYQNDENENIKLEGHSEDDLLNIRTPSSSFELYETRQKRKIIKKQW